MKDNKEDFDSYLIDDDEEDGKRYTMWDIVPLAMINPEQGWKRARLHGPIPEIATIRFLIPLCILAGASEFFALIYPGHYTISGLLVGAVITFCAYFLGYYLSLVLSRILLPRNTRKLSATDYGKLLIMGATGTLAFFQILIKSLQMFDFILEFLPLWTIFIIFQGIKQIEDVESDKILFAIGLLCVIVICCPILIEWILALFL